VHYKSADDDDDDDVIDDRGRPFTLYTTQYRRR